MAISLSFSVIGFLVYFDMIAFLAFHCFFWPVSYFHWPWLSFWLSHGNMAIFFDAATRARLLLFFFKMLPFHRRQRGRSISFALLLPHHGAFFCSLQGWCHADIAAAATSPMPNIFDIALILYLDIWHYYIIIYIYITLLLYCYLRLYAIAI